MELRKQQPRLGHLGLRPALLRVHRDLLTVHGHIVAYSAYYPEKLTTLEKMVIALEDRRFMRHAGVDLKSVVREVVRAAMLRRHGGASTIDMQFVRTATEYKQKTIFRKLYEVLLTIIIQYRYSKIVILRSYLRHAYFGTRLIGADAAARSLYGKAADDLDLDQSAELAAMLVYPKPRKTDQIWSEKVRRRASYGKSIYVSRKRYFDKLPS